MRKETVDTRKINLNTAVNGALITLIFPVIAWIAQIASVDHTLSWGSIKEMHLNNPLFWLVYVIPLGAFAAIIVVQQNRNREISTYEKKLREKEVRIDRNAQFAKEIGNGNYNTTLEGVGEDDVLGNSLLLMRDNLLENNKKEAEQSWIAEGKDIISNILRMHNKIDELSYDVVVNLIKYIDAVQGALYIFDDEKDLLINVATYAYNRKKYINQEFKVGHGLIGQCAYEMDIIYRTEIPDDYATITSGILGDQKPRTILIVPLISDEELQGVIEFASLEEEFSDLKIRYLRELGEIIARTVFNLKINQRTEKLLQESQNMTEELRENEEQLRQNAEEMRATQEELEKSNEKLELQIQQVENAQKRLYSLLENASEIISIYDENMKMTYVSPSVTKILGFTPEEMMGGKDLDRLTRRGEASLNEMFDFLKENPTKAYSIQYTYMKKDGEKIFIEATGRNLLNDPAIKGIILNSQDITERKRAEKEERLKTKMQSLSENSLDMIMRISTAGQFFYANPVIKDYIGLTPKDIINKTLNSIKFSEVLQEYFKEAIVQIKKKPEKTNYELVIPPQEGMNDEDRYMSIDAIPEFNENELETILFVGHDITEAKRIEQEIQEKNKKIEDSINYAERIQGSILPDNKLIREVLPKSFIFYKPRDVVSGDFPWFFKKNGYIYIAAVDCTGHGVPGALLSFIGYFLLNNIVDHDDEYTASQICDNLHYQVRTTLKQDREGANARDGMDIAFCKIDLKNNEVQYAGAHRPLYLLRDGELQEYKGDRKAIGGIPHRKKAEQDFKNYVIKFRKNDKIFFFSDGLPDQLGGPEKKKYSAKRIRETLLEHADFSMEGYEKYFEQDFTTWKGDIKQIDDVLLIGIEF